MLLACVAFAAMWMVIRLASATIHPFEIVFFRNVFGLAALAPMLLYRPALIDPARALPNLRRATSSLVGTLATFYAVANAPLATALAINYTAPLFATVGALLFLGERIHFRRGAALAVGFVGMLVVVRPGALPLTPGIAAAVLSAIATAATYLAIRALIGRDDPRSVAAWQFILMILPSGLIAAFVWHWPTPDAWLLLVVDRHPRGDRTGRPRLRLRPRRGVGRPALRLRPLRADHRRRHRPVRRAVRHADARRRGDHPRRDDLPRRPRGRRRPRPQVGAGPRVVTAP